MAARFSLQIARSPRMISSRTKSDDPMYGSPPRLSNLQSTLLPVRRDLEAFGAEIAINRREQEMRGNSQLLQSRNLVCPEEWKHEDASHASADQRQ